MLTINLPLAVYVSKKKKFILNLNNYRNAHYLALNKAKKRYQEHVTWLLLEHGIKKIEGSVTLTYTYYHPTKGVVDVANPCSVIDKFTCDALSAYGVLPDDRASVIRSVTYQFGGVDKDNPRCELVVLPLVV